MARVKRSGNAKKKRRTVREQASSYRGQRSHMPQGRNRSRTHLYSVTARRRRISVACGVQRINAASRAQGMTYNRFIQGLNLAGVEVDRRMLAELAVNDIAASTLLLRGCEEGSARRRECAQGRAFDEQLFERPSILDNPRADRVGGSRALAGRLASKQGKILVEGPRGSSRTGRCRSSFVEDVYYTSATAQTHPDVDDDAERLCRWVHESR